MTAREFNFDGIVGPTHNYAGLSHGNLASSQHRQLASNPRAAALEGLQKMRRLFEMGVGQVVLPPHPRPHWRLLRQLGFGGHGHDLLRQAAQVDASLLAASYSAASMWAANSATVSPAADCLDHRLHVTPANLTSMLHRSIEAQHTCRLLRAVFAAVDSCQIHDPLPATAALSDEGAANHTRLCREFAAPGIELFVFGRSVFNAARPAPLQFPARQTLECCQAIARCHTLPPQQVVMAQQNPQAIDAGVFHNDVICVGNQNVLLVHDEAFVDPNRVLADLVAGFSRVCGSDLQLLRVSTAELSLQDAVASYLFNSQLVTRADGKMTLLAPSESEENPAARRVTQRLLAESKAIDRIEFVNLRQSMNNGGGPACLRLRVVLNGQQAAQLAPGVIFSLELQEALTQWVHQNYRDSLVPADLLDPQLADESYRALEALAPILGLPVSLLLGDAA